MIPKLTLDKTVTQIIMTLVISPATIPVQGQLSTLYNFEAPTPIAYTSPLGSQPDTRPVLGPGNSVYGMTYDGGESGNGVIYRFDLESRRYTVLHTFSSVDANGNNDDGAIPGVALTRGPGDVFYGVASYGGRNGNGTVFEITASGHFTVLHTFSPLGANGNNWDGANPLRSVVVSSDGSLFGTTRVGGQNTCLFTHGCGVAWRIDSQHNFRVVHQYAADEGHAASLTLGLDGHLYGCAVWPATSLPLGPLPSGIIFRMETSGEHFQVLYAFSQTDANGDNQDGADCYEPLVEIRPGLFYGAATNGGANGNGAVFSYSIWRPGTVEIVHTFSAEDAAGENWDGAYPYARMTAAADGVVYSTASYGGPNGNGVVYCIEPDGTFKILHIFSANDPTTGANSDGAIPDYGVLIDGNKLIGIAEFGGLGSSAGFYNSGGTLYQLTLDDVQQ